MEQKTKFVEGIRMFAAHENAPDFVLASVVITPKTFLEWIKNNATELTEYKGEKQLRLQVLKSKDGAPYMALDNYKKQEKPREWSAPAAEQTDNSMPF